MLMELDFLFVFLFTLGEVYTTDLIFYPYLNNWSDYSLNGYSHGFLGYVLPWGQISFWGATVITNLFSAIPYIGGDLVIWIWGGFAVDNATLTRFFSLHFLLPFIIAGLRIVHLLFLHQTGKNNPLGINRNFDKILFHPYFSSKDLFGFIVIIILLITICFFSMNIRRSWKFYSC